MRPSVSCRSNSREAEVSKSAPAPAFARPEAAVASRRAAATIFGSVADRRKYRFRIKPPRAKPASSRNRTDRVRRTVRHCALRPVRPRMLPSCRKPGQVTAEDGLGLHPAQLAQRAREPAFAGVPQPWRIDGRPQLDDPQRPILTMSYRAPVLVRRCFAEWRRQMRLLEAIDRLGKGHTVTRVALDLGYESPSAFIAMFRRTLGASPGKYFRDAESGNE